MSQENRVKVTFYADPDIKEWVDSLESGLKSRAINDFLRDGMRERSKLQQSQDRMALIEGRIKKLEKDTQFDGFAIAALRRVLLNRFGDLTTAEFKKEYDDLYFGAVRPPRNI